MKSEINELGQPVGIKVTDWKIPPAPTVELLQGKYCRLEKIDAEKHAEEIFNELSFDREGRNWTYLPYGPFSGLNEFASWLKDISSGPDPYIFAIVPEHTKKASGIAAYLRINPDFGSIEVGHLNYSPSLQKTREATEAMYLMMRYAFELGYRRYEWKCNSLNQASKNAAERLGFKFEGVFRQSVVTKGRNRDTSWFSIIDSEWPKIQAALENWLEPSNFNSNGKQHSPLQINDSIHGNSNM